MPEADLRDDGRGRGAQCRLESESSTESVLIYVPRSFTADVLAKGIIWEGQVKQSQRERVTAAMALSRRSSTTTSPIKSWNRPRPARAQHPKLRSRGVFILWEIEGLEIRRSGKRRRYVTQHILQTYTDIERWG